MKVIPPTLPDLHVEDSSDAEEEDEDPDEADDGFAIGSVVWIKIGRLWFPGRVLSPSEVAESLPAGHMFVRRFDPFGDIKRVLVNNIYTLAANRIDAQRSSKNYEINLAYGLALIEVM